VARVKEGVSDICEELKKTFDMFQRTSEGRVRRIYLAGGVAGMEGIDKLIGDAMGLSCEIVNPFRNIKVNPRVFDEEYIEKMGPLLNGGMDQNHGMKTVS